MRLLLIIFVLALIVAVLPVWPTGVGLNLFPSGLLLTVLCIVLLVWLFMSRRVPPV